LVSLHRIVTCENGISRTIAQCQHAVKLSWKMTHSNSSSPPWVVDASIGASSFQWIDSIVTVLPVLIQTVCHGFPVAGGLGKIPCFLSRSKNTFTRETLNAASVRRFERVRRVQRPVSVDMIAVRGELKPRGGEVDIEIISRHGKCSPTAGSRRWGSIWGRVRHCAWLKVRQLGSSMLSSRIYRS
jgi:hypothetical protein